MTKYKTIDLIVIALFAALMAALGTVGAVLNVITGIPLAAVFNGLLGVILTTILALLIRKIGRIIIMWLIVGILYIPGPALGPPGIYKVLLVFPAAIIIEILLLIGKKRLRLTIPIAMALGTITMQLTICFLGAAIGIPGIEKSFEILDKMMIVGFIFGLLGGYIGLKIFDKIKNKAVVKRFLM